METELCIFFKIAMKLQLLNNNLLMYLISFSKPGLFETRHFYPDSASEIGCGSGSHPSILDVKFLTLTLTAMEFKEPHFEKRE
jgi:hypothetical protein